MLKKASYVLSFIKQLCNLIKYGAAYRLSPRTLVEKGALIRVDGKGKLVLGDYTTVRTGAELHADDGEIIFEGNSFVNRNVSIVSHASIRIGKGTTIGPNTVIYDHDHDHEGKEGDYISREIVIGRDVWIGSGCIILKGSRIGDHSVIAAGTLVSGEVPENVIYMNKREAKIIEKKRK